jgi:hypothetical protein
MYSDLKLPNSVSISEFPRNATEESITCGWPVISKELPAKGRAATDHLTDIEQSK